jgi:hypothetical protein
MKRPIRNILSILVILIIYISAILEKIFGTVNLDVDVLFGQYMFFTLLGLGTIFLLSKYLLKNDVKVFIRDKGSFLVDIGFTLLIISFILVFNGLEKVVRDLGNLGAENKDEIFMALEKVFANKNYALFFLGPFLWLSEGFRVISGVFILNNLWELKNNKLWNWSMIVVVAILCSLLQLENGFLGMFTTFLVITATHILYYKYRRVLPLIYATIIYQTIDFIALWIYVL